MLILILLIFFPLAVYTINSFLYYPSFDYEDAGYQESDMIKVTMLLNHVPVGSLSIITHRSKAYTQGKLLAAKLKEVIKRQQFEVAIQAAIGKKVIARETYQNSIFANNYEITLPSYL